MFGGILAALYLYYIAFRVPVGKDFELDSDGNTIQGRKTVSNEIKSEDEKERIQSTLQNDSSENEEEKQKTE